MSLFARFVNWWNASPYILTFNVHAWFSCTLVYHASIAMHRHFHLRLLYCAIAVLVLWILVTAWKEFWFDLRYEVPAQTVADSTADFIGYRIGDVLAVLLMAIGA